MMLFPFIFDTESPTESPRENELYPSVHPAVFLIALGHDRLGCTDTDG